MQNSGCPPRDDLQFCPPHQMARAGIWLRPQSPHHEDRRSRSVSRR